MTECPWCLDPDAEEWDDSLCPMHEAEYDGLSEYEAERRDAERDAEWADTRCWA